MYKRRNGRLYAGPAWDFDWGTFRGADEWIIKDAIWYSYLFTYPEFTDRVKERWQTHRPTLIDIPDYIQSFAGKIEESSIYDGELWPITQYVNGDEEMSFPESIRHMKQIYIERFNWIDNNIKSL